MIRNTLLFAFLILGTQCLQAQQEHRITTDELLKWEFHGQGEMSQWGDQVILKEAVDTKGVMLISPEKYAKDVVMRYKVMALTPATVLVSMLAMSDVGSVDELTLSDDYDGNMGLWIKEKDNYFFAYKNAPHNATPFLRRYPNPGELISAKDNSMIAGVYYDVEVGKKGDLLWLSIDGKKIFKTKDESPLKGGHVAVRIRGVKGFNAGCIIKEMTIIE
jgi:hypothetical protein